jgi:hypothetical protein
VHSRHGACSAACLKRRCNHLPHNCDGVVGEVYSDVSLLAFTIPISDPDFGFGVDPGRLCGYPLAHLAGTWW